MSNNPKVVSEEERIAFLLKLSLDDVIRDWSLLDYGLPRDQWKYTDVRVDNSRDRPPVRRAANDGYRGDAGRLFVRNVSYNTTEQTFRSAFEPFGPLIRSGLNYTGEGRSMGSGFVIYERKQDARNAFFGLNGKTVDGRPLRISFVNGSSGGDNSRCDGKCKVRDENISSSSSVCRRDSDLDQYADNKPKRLRPVITYD